jgi:hypothetical protein
LHELRLAALRIQIFVAENQLAALLGRPLRRDAKRACMPDV